MVVVKREDTSIKKDIYYPFEITDVEVGYGQFNYNRFHFTINDEANNKTQKIQHGMPTSLSDYAKLTRFLNKLGIVIPVNTEIDTEWLKELIGTTGLTKLTQREVVDKETKEIKGVFPDIIVESIMQVKLSALSNLKIYINNSPTIGTPLTNVTVQTAAATVTTNSDIDKILNQHVINVGDLLTPKTDVIKATFLNKLPSLKEGCMPEDFVKVANEISREYQMEPQKLIDMIKTTEFYVVEQGKIKFR